MSYIKVKRPKLTLGEKCYLKSIIGGMIITLKHALSALLRRSKSKSDFNATSIGITMQYPETTWDDKLPEYYRGAPALVKDESGRERCVSCQLCEFICPPKAIRIVPGSIDGKSEKAPKEFEINMTRCIYCGMCEEVCPEQAIFLSQEYLIIKPNREDMINDKNKLYELGGTRKGLVNKWNEYK